MTNQDEKVKKLERIIESLKKQLEVERKINSDLIFHQTVGKKYYAVACEKQVKGFSGAKYKSFESEIVAKSWLDNQDENIPEWQRELNLLDTNWD